MPNKKEKNMKIETLENGAVKCVVDSMEDVFDLIISGKSKNITQLDLSKIGNVVNSYNFFRDLFSIMHFPKLDYIKYDNPNGKISAFAFYDSQVKKADINCFLLDECAFDVSVGLKEINLKDTLNVHASGFLFTKVRKIEIPPKTKSLYIPKINPVRVVFKEYDAQGLPISNLEHVDMGNPTVYLKHYGFDNFKDLLLFNPQLFLDCKHVFSPSELKVVKKVTKMYFERTMQKIEQFAEENPIEADEIARQNLKLLEDVDNRLKYPQYYIDNNQDRLARRFVEAYDAKDKDDK